MKQTRTTSYNIYSVKQADQQHRQSHLSMVRRLGVHAQRRLPSASLPPPLHSLVPPVGI